MRVFLWDVDDDVTMRILYYIPPPHVAEICEFPFAAARALLSFSPACFLVLNTTTAIFPSQKAYYIIIFLPVCVLTLCAFSHARIFLFFSVCRDAAEKLGVVS